MTKSQFKLQPRRTRAQGATNAARAPTQSGLLVQHNRTRRRGCSLGGWPPQAAKGEGQTANGNMGAQSHQH